MERPSPATSSFMPHEDIPFVKGFSPAALMQKIRGKAPKGCRWRSASVYWPAGEYQNVTPTKIKNPKIAANIQKSHENWWNKKLAREAQKTACV